MGPPRAACDWSVSLVHQRVDDNLTCDWPRWTSQLAIS